ncbi:hypothetical protein PBRA_003291 [Plasmodiophora brassicae]|uniref:VTT domain-containing protein n=1 Tax=Plasmodiophora brassicae TaxID=37360 RepID=A0A0G4J8L9_PLABS|nr:hypothetical protein PBRA_003291 [Plasmodiophora brassicae]
MIGVCRHVNRRKYRHRSDKKRPLDCGLCGRRMTVRPRAVPSRQASSVASRSPTSSSASPRMEAPVTRRTIVIRCIIAVGVVGAGVLSFLLLPRVVDFLTRLQAGFDSRKPGYIVMFAALFFSNGTPVSIASTFVAITAGFLYRWVAFPIGYGFVVLGSQATFLLVRWLVGQGHVSPDAMRQRFGRYADHIAAFEGALEDHGVEAVALVQLSLLPFGICNALFGFTDVHYRDFALATCLTRVKVLLYITIGMTATNVVNALQSIRDGKFDVFEWHNLPFFITLISSVAAFFVLRKHIRKRLHLMRALQHRSAHDSQEAGFDTREPGYIVLFSALFFLNGTPASMGSTFVAITAGFLFKWVALPMGYSFLVFGTQVTFLLVRWLVGQGHISPNAMQQRFGKYAEHIAAFEGALEDHGVEAVTMIQLSVLPFGICTALFGFTGVRYRDFALATCLSRVKILLYILIGMTATDLANALRSIRDGNFDRIEWRHLPFFITLISSVAAFFVLRKHIRKRLHLMRAKQHCSAHDSSDASSNAI